MKVPEVRRQHDMTAQGSIAANARFELRSREPATDCCRTDAAVAGRDNIRWRPW